MTVSIMAVDPSLTSLGLCYGSTETPAISVIRPKDRRGCERIAYVRTQLRGVLRTFPTGGTIMGVIEGPAYATDTSRVYDMGGMGWAIRQVWHDHGIPWLEVPPSNLKMFATGKGNASKSLVTSEATKRTGITFATDDAADALVLYCIGREKRGLPHPLGQLPQTHLRALEKVTSES